MWAQVLHDIGDIRYEEAPMPSLQEDMVLVKVMAAGICGSDIPRIYKTGAHRMPLIPGHEFSGMVTAVYGKGTNAAEDGTVSGIPKDGIAGWIGKRVGIFPLIPCMKCPQCLKKQYEMCRNYNYLGSRTDGGFAEYVAVPTWNLIELPSEVTYEQAAMLEPTSVAMHAIRAMHVQKEETVAVCGLGTIGLLIAMMLKGMGIEKVFALGNKAAQQGMAEKIGIQAEEYCDTRTQDPDAWLKERTQGQGATVFFECIGKNDIVELAIQGTAPGGRVMLVGNPASDMELPRDVYWQILRKQLTLKGTWNSSYLGEEADDWHLVIQALSEGKIHPELFITHRFPLDNLTAGLEIMRDKTEDYVKVMTFPHGVIS